MLKTNSKQAKENIKKYILDGFTPEDYGIETPDNFADAAKIIYKIFHEEKPYKTGYKPESVIFEDWAAGLPSIIDTCYYYNRSAVDDLGEILEQTEAEKSKYTEQEAEKRLTALIYQEIKNAL